MIYFPEFYGSIPGGGYRKKNWLHKTVLAKKNNLLKLRI